MAALRIPRERGGWWHDYICRRHGVELTHVGMRDGVFPEAGAPCPHGCRVDTPEVRGAWTVLAHQACAAEVWRLAHGDASQRAEAAAALREYAELYLRFVASGLHEEAQPWMLPGRLFHQALTEAIWAVSIAEAAWTLIDAGEPGLDRVRKLLHELAVAAEASRDVLVGDGRFRSNYVAWLNAAGAVCSRDPSWLTGPAGVYAHSAAAILPDGWEWEVSTYYHAFVLRAYLLALRTVPTTDIPAAVRRRLRAMVSALSTVRTPGGVVPALNDSPFARRLTEAEYQRTWELADRAALYPEPPSSVSVFAEGGLAVVRSAGVHAILDFGPHGGSHGHFDKLALHLYGATTAWQPDPGQVPYGHRRWRDHYRGTAAHATFSVDRLPQAECRGFLLHSEDNEVMVACHDAYPGVSAFRRLRVCEDGLIDELTVTSRRRCDIAVQLRPAVPIRTEPQPDGSTATTWQGRETLRGHHECDVPARFVTRPGAGTADDPQRVRTHIDWTASATAKATFRSHYRVIDHVQGGRS